MKWWTLSIAAALALTVVLAMLGWPATQYRDNDFSHFWVASRALIDGQDPYDVATWDTYFARIGSRGLANAPGLAFRYPLPTALVFVPFALLPIGVAAPLWLVSQLAVALVALVMLARTLFPGTLRRDLTVLLAFVGASQPAALLLAGGNLGGFLLGTAGLSAALLLRGRPVAAGAVAGLLIVKPHPLIVALPLVLIALPRGSGARVAGAAAVTGGALVLASFAVRPSWLGEWSRPLLTSGYPRTDHATLFGALPGDLTLLGWIVVLILAGAFALWERRRPLAIVIGAAIPLSVFAAPYGWSYDYILLAIPAAVVIAVVARASPAARAAVLVSLAVTFVLVPWVLYAIAFQRGDESWSVVVPLVALVPLALSRWAVSTRQPQAAP